MRRIEIIPAPSCSRPTSFRGPEIRTRQADHITSGPTVKEEPVSKMIFVNLPAPALEALLSH
jgi:hypothetical protein